MKQTLIYLAIILLAAAVSFGLIHQRNVQRAENMLRVVCPADNMMCPDGASVPRSGPRCEFGTCPQTKPLSTEPQSATTTSSSTPVSIHLNTGIPKNDVPQGVLTKIVTSATSIFKKTNKDVTTGVKETSNVITPSVPQAVTPTNPVVQEIKYTVKDNKVVDQNNNVIYTNPPSSGSTLPTHIVNILPVGNVAPIVGAIPVTGLPGKYYLSENSFGNAESCEFSNKIYILDTATGVRTLMYEENSSTLPPNDPRACNSEMYLLSTEAEKLVIKYHTVGTNMICESSWSEPEKTWYLDVTNLSNGTKRYYISPTLYAEAEKAEELCRSQLNASSTP